MNDYSLCNNISYFSIIPIELKEKILSEVHCMQTLAKCIQVCAQWETIINNQNFLKLVSLKIINSRLKQRSKKYLHINFLCTSNEELINKICIFCLQNIFHENRTLICYFPFEQEYHIRIKRMINSEHQNKKILVVFTGKLADKFNDSTFNIFKSDSSFTFCSESPFRLDIFLAGNNWQKAYFLFKNRETEIKSPKKDKCIIS